MLTRILARVVVSVVVMVSAASALAQPAAPGAARGSRQAINLLLGGFVPRGEDGPPHTLIQGRAPGDVLVNTQLSFLRVEIADFKSAAIGAEWLLPLGSLLEIGTGVTWSARTVHTPYDGDIDTDGTDVVADLKLRIVPISVTARVLPLGHAFRVQPYVGGGVAFVGWRYQQAGEYADIFNVLAPPPGPCTFECPYEIFKPPPARQFTASGFAAGPVLLGGVRFAAGAVSVGGEIRYQRAVGDLGRDNLFLGSSIDLGGVTYQTVLGVRLP